MNTSSLAGLSWTTDGYNVYVKINVSSKLTQLRKKNVPIFVATLLESTKPLEQFVFPKTNNVLQTHFVKEKLKIWNFIDL